MEPTTLLIAATAMQAVGAIQQGNSAAAQMTQHAQAAEYNAAVSRQQADQALQVSTAEQLRSRREARQILGRQRAQMAESGVGFSGSSGDVLERSETLAELDALNVAYEGMLRARSFTTQAELDDFQSRAYRANARSAKTAGYLRAAGHAAMGAYEFSKMPGSPTTPKTTVSGSGFGIRPSASTRSSFGSTGLRYG